MTTREVPLKKGQSALIVIDLQKGFAVPGQGQFKDIDPGNIPEHLEYFFTRLQSATIPNTAKLIRACEKYKCEVIYTYIECLTQDGRDQSLDYKITGFCVPKGSPDAEILDVLKPSNPMDTIMLPKTSCSVFNSTNVEYVLRQLGVSQVAICGIVTNECVESAVRDAADLGFLVTLVEDCTATRDQASHDAALKTMKGFARIVSQETVIEEISQW